MLDIQVDARSFSLFHASKHLYINGAEDVFHSSAQLFIGGVVTHSHYSLDTTHKELLGVVRSGLHGGHVNGATDFGGPWSFWQLGKCSFNTSCTERAKCMCAPLCCGHTSSMSLLSLSWGWNHFSNIAK
jgi:hypothetical protein